MILYGLSISVEQDGITPTQHDSEGTPFFGLLRFEGWAAALAENRVEHLYIVGGLETLPLAAIPTDPVLEKTATTGRVPRGALNKHILTTQFGADPDRITWLLSEGNTGGNLTQIREHLATHSKPAAICSNAYHLPRALMDMTFNGLCMPAIPAEAYILAASKDRQADRERLQSAFGDVMGTRMVKELNGCADKLIGTYTPLSR